MGVGWLDAFSLFRSTPCIGKCFVTLSSAHYIPGVLPIIMTSTSKAPPQYLNAPRYGENYFPHSETTGGSRGRVLFICVSPVAGTYQAINNYSLNWQMNDCLSWQWILKEVHPFLKYILLSIKKKLWTESALCVRWGTKYLECTVTKQRWSLSKWVLESSGEGRQVNKKYRGSRHCHRGYKGDM